MNQQVIVYVDDDADDRMIFEEAFDKSNGYDLVTLGSGEELFNMLLTRIQQGFPCLIIVDINIPQQSGIDILRILKTDQRYAAIPVVMFSTSATPKECLECEEFGTDIIVKPSSFQELQKAQQLLLQYCHGNHGRGQS